MEGSDAVTGSLRGALESGESIEVTVRATLAVVVVTDRRVIIDAGEPRPWAVALAELRRVEFDVERGRAGTLSIVPDSVASAPQVLSIPGNELPSAIRALAIIAQHLSA